MGADQEIGSTHGPTPDFESPDGLEYATGRPERAALASPSESRTKMLIARLQSDYPLAAARLTGDDNGETSMLEGVGEIAPVKLLAMENRRQLIRRVDEATRGRMLRAAVAGFWRESASSAVARARAAAAPDATAKHEAAGKPPGIPAASTKADAPGEDDLQGGRVVSTHPLVSGRQRCRTADEVALRHCRRWAWATVAVVPAAPVALGLPLLPQVARRLAISSIRQVPSHAELHLTDPATPPTSLGVRGPNPLGFTVFKHEGRERFYEGVATLAGPHGSSVAERGSIGLNNNTRGARVVDVAPVGRHGADTITVTSANPPQSIHLTGRL